MRSILASGFLTALAVGCRGSQKPVIFYFALDNTASSVKEQQRYPAIVAQVLSLAAGRDFRFSMDSFANQRASIYTLDKLPLPSSREAATLLRRVRSIGLSGDRGTFFAPVLIQAANLARQNPNCDIVLLCGTDAGVDDVQATSQAVKECGAITNLTAVALLPVTNRGSAHLVAERLFKPLGNRLVLGTEDDYATQIEDLLARTAR